MIQKPLSTQECKRIGIMYGFKNLSDREAKMMFMWLEPSDRQDVIFGGLGPDARRILTQLEKGDYPNPYVQDLYAENGAKILFKDWVGDDPLLLDCGRVSMKTLDVYSEQVFKTSFRDYVEGKGVEFTDRKLHNMVQHGRIALYIELLIKTVVQPDRAIGERLQEALNVSYAGTVGGMGRTGPFKWDTTAREAFHEFQQSRMHHNVLVKPVRGGR